MLFQGKHAKRDLPSTDAVYVVIPWELRDGFAAESGVVLPLSKPRSQDPPVTWPLEGS
jgi:hypothetical protein